MYIRLGWARCAGGMLMAFFRNEGFAVDGPAPERHSDEEHEGGRAAAGLGRTFSAAGRLLSQLHHRARPRREPVPPVPLLRPRAHAHVHGPGDGWQERAWQVGSAKPFATASAV